jgi:predicted RecA/RadA family phage recombinase
MTVKFVQVGSVIDFTTAGAVAVGDLLVMGHTLGVAMKAAAGSGEVIPVAIEGVFSGLPKVSAAVFAVGEKLILDVSATPDAFDDSAATPATGDITGAAIAVVAGANTETTCTVKLTPGNTTIT